MDVQRSLGINEDSVNLVEERRKLQLYINLTLASSGQPTCVTGMEAEYLDITHDLLKSYREKNRLLTDYLCPADQRIQDFLQRYLKELPAAEVPTFPSITFILDRHGVARELSLPLGEDEFHSAIVSSYRVKQGVLHNPASDRRTTKGSFHIAEGGLPIPGDKKAVPSTVFAALLKEAFNPPKELLQLPFTANQSEKAEMFVSLLLRPIICRRFQAVTRRSGWRSAFLPRAIW